MSLGIGSFDASPSGCRGACPGRTRDGRPSPRCSATPRRTWPPQRCAVAGAGAHAVPGQEDLAHADTAGAGAGADAHDGRLLLSVAEAAALLGISRAYAYELVMAGELASVKLGRLRKVRRSDLLAYVDSLGADG